MRVGILASEMQGTPTGVGRFLRGLLGQVGRCRPNWRFLLFFQGDPFEDPLWQDTALEPIFFGSADTNRVRFEQFQLGRRLPKLDVFFAPAYSLPRGLQCPSIVAIHDLSFEVLPEEFRWKERWRRRWLARRAAKAATRVLTISPLVARQLQELYHVEEDRIAVLPLAVDELFAQSPTAVEDPVLEPPYLLFAGSILARRRLDVVLEAFSILLRDRPRLRLVLAGGNRLRHPGDVGRWIDRFNLASKVVQLGFVDDPHFLWLLRNAELSFYVSTYEGFGLPPLESLAAGTAVVTSTGLALDDLWPEYPYRCTSIDVEEIVRVSRCILDQEEERSRVLSEGAKMLEGLTWERSANLFLQEVERALGA